MGFKNWMFGGDATKGMPTGPQDNDWLRTHLKTSTEQAAPTIGPAATGLTDQSRGQQGQLAQMLFRQAAGQAPGAGELAVQRQANNAMANQASMAQMARGAGAGMAARNAARTSADIGTNAAGQASIAQMQDQQAAQGQLGSLLGTMRGQDLGQRGQDIGVSQGNQQAQLAQQGQNLQAVGQLLGVNQAQMQQDAARRQLALQDKGMAGSLLQVGGQLGAAYLTGGGSAAAPGMSPIASGYPGQGGYYTPTSQQMYGWAQNQPMPQNPMLPSLLGGR